MDKITESLKKILPDDQVNEVAKAVEAMMAEAEEEIRGEASKNLDEAYQKLSEELEGAEVVAEQGYQQAYEIIADLTNRLDNQREEFEDALEKGFEEAYDKLKAEESKNSNIEVEVYEDFDNRLKEMKDFMIDKIDAFLDIQEQEIYDKAKAHILNDPRMIEHKVALDKVAEVMGNYLSDDDYSAVTSSKVDDIQREVEHLKGQLRILESKNVKLKMNNDKLGEQVNEAHGLLTEATKQERKERASKKRKASGRGQRVAETQEQILAEYVNPATIQTKDQKEVITEGRDELNDLLVLSGLQESY